MEQIITDISNLHWWFNIIIGLVIIIIGYAITEFLIKPLGQSYIMASKKRTKETNVEESEIIMQLKKDQRKEMRMHFRLTYIRQAISLKLFLIAIIILGIPAFIFISDFWPIRIAAVGSGFWILVGTMRDTIKLIRYQEYCLRILQKVQGD